MGHTPVLTSINEWEAAWAPYDETTYRFVLDQILPGDIVIDIGAGDLRLAVRMAAICQRVYAVEISSEIVMKGKLALNASPPENLDIIIADATKLDFPGDINVGVLLMRHCSYFSLFRKKLITSGANKMITNARQRMNIEIVDLLAEPKKYNTVELGWYACECGIFGFKPGAVELLNSFTLETIHEVASCPGCSDLASEAIHL